MAHSVTTRIVRTPMTAAMITDRLRRDGSVYLGAGTYNISQPVYVPSNATLEGVGPRTELRCSGDYPAIVFLAADGSGRAQNSRVANLKITRSNTSGSPSLQAESDGVRVLGDDLILEGLTIEDCFRGIRLVEDATPSERITVLRCKITHANALNNTSTYGIDCADVRNLIVRDTHVRGSWLDGLKLRKNTRDVLVEGGSYCENGVYGAGDGLDGYVGGDTFKMIGVLCADNVGNGAQIKTGPLTPDDGYARKFEISNCTFRNNTVVGLTINTSTIDAPTNTGLDIMTAYARVIGCLFESNGHYGLFLRGRNFEVVAPTCLSNGNYGLVAITDALDVTIQGGHYVGNVNGGMYITGQRITVVAPTCIGKEDPDIDSDSDYAGVVATQPYGIVLASVCDDVVIENPRGHSNGTAYWSMQGDFTGKRVIINASGSGEPAIPGSPGSTYRRTDTGGLYVKATGAAQQVTGWVDTRQAHGYTRIHPTQANDTSPLTLTSGRAYAYYMSQAPFDLSAADALAHFASGGAAVGSGWSEIAIATGELTTLALGNNIDLTVRGYADIDVEAKVGIATVYEKTISGLSIPAGTGVWVILAQSHDTTQLGVRAWDGVDLTGRARYRENFRPSLNVGSAVAFTASSGLIPATWIRYP